MKTLLTSMLLASTLISCGPNAVGWSQDVDDLITREACSVTVDKSAMSPNTDIDISIKLKPATPPPVQPVLMVHPVSK